MKQILLVVVQGIEEEDLLYPIFREKNGEFLVKFVLLRSDYLSRRSTVNHAKEWIEDLVTAYMATHHLRVDDLCGVVQLTTSAGIYLRPDRLRVDLDLCREMGKRVVEQEGLLVFDRTETLKNYQRLSQQKRLTIMELVDTTHLFDHLPYHLYYTSKPLRELLDVETDWTFDQARSFLTDPTILPSRRYRTSWQLLEAEGDRIPTLSNLGQVLEEMAAF